MKLEVNYIKHHKNAFTRMFSDDDITPIDISIYNALFLIWNHCDFECELSINRNDIMKMAKVGNANTYTKSLKKLHNKGYLIYKPSHNPLIGSKVTMCRYDKSSGKSSDKGYDKSSGKSTAQSSDKGGDTLYKTILNPINYTNNINIKKNKKTEINPSENFQSNQSPLKTLESVSEEKEKSSAKKEKELDPFKDLLLENGAEEDDVDEWFKNRIDNRKKTTRYFVEQFMMECKKNSFSVKESVHACAFNGWVNFNAQWLINQKKSNDGTTTGNNGAVQGGKISGRANPITVEDILRVTSNPFGFD